MKIQCDAVEAELLMDTCVMTNCEDCILYRFCKEDNEHGELTYLIEEV